MKIRNFLMAWLVLCLWMIFVQPVTAQILDSENKISVTLSDGTGVTLYGKSIPFSKEFSNEYYYLPTNLHIAENPDGSKQLLILKYTTESGDVEGGLLHLLVEFGLTKEQETELLGILRNNYDPDIRLRGVVNVEPDGNNSVRITSATLASGDAKQMLLMSGEAPVMPGNKIAFATKMDKYTTQLFTAPLENDMAIADFSITFSYNYDVQFPAADGFIIENWSRFDSLNVVDTAAFTKVINEDGNFGEKAGNLGLGFLAGGPIGAAIGLFSTGNRDKTHYTYDELHQMYKVMEEQGVITMKFEVGLLNEEVAKVRDAFFQYFLTAFTEKDGTAPPVSPGRAELTAMPDIKQGNSYHFKRAFVETIHQKRNKVFNLNYAMPIQRSFQITENLVSWYGAIPDRSKYIETVVLNDPFFEHRNIHFILDLDAREMRGEGLNFVTLMLRKQRTDNRAGDFDFATTFYSDDFEEKINRITATYAKLSNEVPRMYEYKLKWSFRGGNIQAQDTSWTKGSWQAVTLVPPIKSIPITFEADLEELKDYDLRNATLQLRYQKFGKEVETNITLRTKGQTAFIDKKIFMDKEAKGYAYRFVFNHKRKGILATDWESKINTNYIFAYLPDAIRKADETMLAHLMENGDRVTGGGNMTNTVAEEDAILADFEELIGGNN